MNNLLLIAAKKKYRFNVPGKGNLNVEQLFELPQTALDGLYRNLESQIQVSSGLLGRRGNTEIENKLEIVKAVFEEIVTDAEKASSKLENGKLKQTLLAIAEEKELEEMTGGKSAKELKKMARKLDS